MPADRTSSLARRVFVSHQWRDKQYADRLARDLEPFADVWMDFRRLRPGDPIQATIDQALEDVDLVLVVWTGNAGASKGVAAEIVTSVSKGLRVVPCLFEYDTAGNPQPPLHPAIADRLGVDFHHYGTGLAQIAHLLVDLDRAALPQEVTADADPRDRLLEYLRGYMQYLANYRSVRGVEDQRAQWVDNIIGEIERFVADGGDTAAVGALIDAARRGNADDEDISLLAARIEAALEKRSVASPLGAMALAPPDMASADMANPVWAAPPPPPHDDLARRLADVSLPGEEAQNLRDVETYLEVAPAVLDALAASARSAASSAGNQVVQYLAAYLDSEDDLVPDRLGRYGLLDDAWLIVNTAFRLIESGLLPAAAVPLDWPTIARADALVQALVPADALAALTGIVMECLQTIAVEVHTYQPWFAPQGRGYAPTIGTPASRGGAWEDEINAMLLGTGLSV
jgi:uncharacterized membrane protein YkvA (DUF1232 family)